MTSRDEHMIDFVTHYYNNWEISSDRWPAVRIKSYIE